MTATRAGHLNRLVAVMLITVMTVLSAIATVPARPVAAQDSDVHQHADGSIHVHEHDAVDVDADGSVPRSVPEETCEQMGLHPVPGSVTARLCTHGPDPAPPGFDITRDVELVIPSDGATSPEQVWCSGDGTSGKRVQVIYARASDVPDRYSEALPSIRQWAADASRIFDLSAANTGGFRQIRFVHDASCFVTVDNVTLSPAGDDNFGATQRELLALGYNRTDRKYMVFVDANVICGQGNILGDDQPGAANFNNGGPSFGRIDAGCWGGWVAAHELMHNLGGVQSSAPNSTFNRPTGNPGWHCVDDFDVMCYSDFDSDGDGRLDSPPMQIVCSDTGQEDRFDCGNDDYYHTSPPAGTYLADHWNAANSEYLIIGTGNCPDAQLEPDDSANEARFLIIGGTETRAFCSSFDEDWYAFEAIAGDTYRIETLNLAAGNDTVLHLYAGNGVTELASNDDSGGTLASLILWTAPSSGTYYVKIHRFAFSANLNWTYDFRILVESANQPPVVRAPAQSLPATRLGTNTAPVKLVWSATDPNGVSTYELQRSTDGGAFTKVTLPSPTAKNFTLQLTPGTTYQFRVRATDQLGAVSDWAVGPRFKLKAYQEANSAISYHGTWTTATLSGAFGGSVKHASAAGAKATLTFTGTSVEWVSTKASNRGKAEVWLDGVKVATVDLYAASTTTRKVVYATNSLANTTHTLEIRVLGTKNASSTGTRVDFDAVVDLRLVS